MITLYKWVHGGILYKAQLEIKKKTYTFEAQFDTAQFTKCLYSSAC